MAPVIAACVVMPITGLGLIVVLALQAKTMTNWSLMRKVGHVALCVCAFEGCFLLLFAGSSVLFILVGDWDSDASNQASALLPEYMRDPSHLNHAYAGSTVAFGNFGVRCSGDKYGCAMDHIFSPVVPPEPPTRFNDGSTKKDAFYVIEEMCGNGAKGATDRNSYDISHTPHLYGWWNREMNLAQRQVLKAVCGGKFRNSRAAFIVVGFLTLAHLAIVWAASSVSDGGLPYLLPAMWCCGGALYALIAASNWVDFVDVVDRAYPFRDVASGPAVTMTSLAAYMLFVAAAIAIALIVEGRFSSNTTKSPLPSGRQLAPAPRPVESPPEQEMVAAPVLPMATVVGVAQEVPGGEAVAFAGGAEKQVLLTGTVVKGPPVEEHRL